MKKILRRVCKKKDVEEHIKQRDKDSFNRNRNQIIIPYHKLLDITHTGFINSSENFDICSDFYGQPRKQKKTGLVKLNTIKTYTRHEQNTCKCTN